MNFQKSGVMNAIVFFSILDTEQRWEGSPAAPLKIQWRSGANSQKSGAIQKAALQPSFRTNATSDSTKRVIVQPIYFSYNEGPFDL